VNLTGQTLGERYRFEELIGEGTFARVYRVHDLKRNVDLAAKVLRPDIAQEPSFMERFRREAAVLERLQHPHIVRYYETLETPQAVFMLLDYIPADNMQSYLYKLGGPVSIRHALHFLKPLTAALTYAHGEGVIHRDIKPANILLGNNGQVYLTDFGIARLLNEASTLTHDKSIGSPLYMAPEQLQGRPVSLAADVYALGVLLYQMFTGQPPFIGQSSQAKGDTLSDRVAYEHIHLAPPPPRHLNPEISPAAEAVVLRCLQKEATARYLSALAIYEAMAEAIGATPANLEAVAWWEGKPQAPNRTLPEWSKVLPPVPAQGPTHAQAPVMPPVPASPNTLRHDPVASQQTLPHQFRVEPAPTLPAPSISAPQPYPPTLTQAPPYYYPPAPAARPYNCFWASLALMAILTLAVCLGGSLYALGLLGEQPERVGPAAAASHSPLGTVGGGNMNPFSTPNPNTPPTATAALNAGPTATLSIGGPGFVFARENQGDLDIFYWSMAEGRETQLTTSPLNETGANYSPDGSQILYYAYEGNGPADIWLMDADGGNARPVFESEANERVAVWSPDGAFIAYHSNFGGDYDLFLYELATGQSRNLTNSPYNEFGPAWSPDGTRLLFHSDQRRGYSQIEQINRDGSGRQTLTSGDWRAAFAAWSPDGSQIAFHAILGSNTYELYRIQADGTGQDRLLTGDNQRQPDWSPDGVGLLYVTGGPGSPEIYYLDLAGGGTQKITSGEFPHWRP
jgi:serine/threonine-protein kinase